MNQALAAARSPGAPLIIAHRGASRYAPENTLAAFRLAADMGADAVEVDAMLTGDGRVVAHHDGTLDRTTSGSGRVSDHSLAQLKQLDAGRRFDARFAGEAIPTLEEVFAAVGRDVLVNVDLRPSEGGRDALPEAAIRLVRAFDLQSRVLISSFDPLALRRTKALAPEIATGLLIWGAHGRLRRALVRSITAHPATHPEDRLVTAGVVEAEHRGGRVVHVWTVNEPSRILELIGWGVDGLITDIPDVAREVRDERI